MLNDTEKTRIIERMCQYIPLALSQGIKLENISGEEVTIRLPYRKELVGNPETGAIHSGTLTLLLDHALGTAVLCCDKVGTVMSPTLDLRVDHLSIVPAGKDIIATARVYKTTRRVLFVEGFAYWESRDKPVAKATGSWVFTPGLSLEELLPSIDMGAQQQ